MVAALNPAWNVPCTDSEIDQRFEKASILMGEAFLSKLDFYGKSWLPARSIVVDALSQRKALDSKCRILHLPQFCPWKVSPPHPPSLCPGNSPRSIYLHLFFLSGLISV